MWIAIIVAAVAAMIIGHLWYGPLFGKQWRKLTGMKKEDVHKEDMPKMMIMALLNSLVMMYVLYQFIMMGDTTMMGAIMTAFWVWLGFLMTQQVSATLRSKKPSIELVVLNGIYWLVVAVVAAILFTVI
jgi:hypothetical protein